MHRWSEVGGDEQRGYRTTCEDCGLPAWGGTPAAAMTPAQQMDRRRLAWARQPAGTPRTVVEDLLRHLDPPDAELLPDEEMGLALPPGRQRERRCCRCGELWSEEEPPCCVDPVDDYLTVTRTRRSGGRVLESVIGHDGEVIAAVWVSDEHESPDRPWHPPDVELTHDDELDLAPPAAREHDGGLDRGL